MRREFFHCSKAAVNWETGRSSYDNLRASDAIRRVAVRAHIEYAVFECHVLKVDGHTEVSTTGSPGVVFTL